MVLCPLNTSQVLEMKIWIYWYESNSWIYYILIKTEKFTVPKQSFTGLGPEDKCSSWGLQVWMYVNKLTFLYTCTSLSWHLDKHNHSHSHLAISDPVCTGFPCKHKHLWTQIFYTNFIQQEILFYSLQKYFTQILLSKKFNLTLNRNILQTFS